MLLDWKILNIWIPHKHTYVHVFSAFTIELKVTSGFRTAFRLIFRTIDADFDDAVIVDIADVSVD